MHRASVMRAPHAAGLAVVIAAAGIGGAALAAGAGPSKSTTPAAQVAPLAQNTSSQGFELDYFHVYKGSGTYAIELKSGLRASFDFANGTATLHNAAGDQKTFPLRDALIAANNGDVDAAMETYDQMQHSLDDAHSDAVVAYAGGVANAAGTHRFPTPPRENVGLPGFGDGLWSTPVGGACWPARSFCQQWPGGLSNWGWGLYTQ